MPNAYVSCACVLVKMLDFSKGALGFTELKLLKTMAYKRKKAALTVQDCFHPPPTGQPQS